VGLRITPPVHYILFPSSDLELGMIVDCKIILSSVSLAAAIPISRATV